MWRHVIWQIGNNLSEDSAAALWSFYKHDVQNYTALRKEANNIESPVWDHRIGNILKFTPDIHFRRRVITKNSVIYGLLKEHPDTVCSGYMHHRSEDAVVMY
jgi:hypothetical protein